MNYRTFVAWLVWAVDTDQLSLPVDQAWENFKQNAESLKRTFTDPKEPAFFCEKCVGESPIEMMTDYVLFFAKTRIIGDWSDNGSSQYGKLTETILKVA
jgi:hypothetical protein